MGTGYLGFTVVSAEFPGVSTICVELCNLLAKNG